MSKAVRCDICSSEMTSQIENYRDQEIGLDNVTLEGILVHRCPKCGGVGYDIPRMAPLHRTIARALVEKKARLLPKEVRFLRKHMELGSGECAEQLGVDPATMSRYESAENPTNMSRQTERLFRVMVLIHMGGIEPGQLHLERFAIEEPKPQRLILRPHRQGWEYRWESASKAEAA